MTQQEIEARAAAETPKDRAALTQRASATSEADIRRHMIEDGENPDAAPPESATLSVPPRLVREKFHMTQEEFAQFLGISVKTLRNWEQNRYAIDPAAQTLLRLIYREPKAAMRALTGETAA